MVPQEEGNEHQDDKKDEKIIETPIETPDSIKQEVLRSGIELNVAPPMDLDIQMPLPVDKLGFDLPESESPVQMSIPPTQEFVAAPIAPLKPTKPRDKLLVKIDQLMDASRNFVREYKYEQALKHINDSINLLKKTKYKSEHARALLYGGHILNIIRKSDEAKALLEEGVQVIQAAGLETSTLCANLKVELGIALQGLGKYESAIATFTEAGTLFQHLGSASEYIRTLWNKGITYYNMQDWKSAVELYLEIARESAKESMLIDSRLKSLQRIGDLIQMVGKHDEGEFDSEKYLEEIDSLKADYQQALAHEARVISKRGYLDRLEAEQARDPANLALWHFNLAAAELTAQSGNLDSAIDHYNKSVGFYTEIGDRLGLSRCYQHLAYIKEKHGALEEAIQLLRQCIELREDLKETLKTEEYRTAIQAELIPIYDELSFLEAKLQRFDRSLNAIEQSKSRELINVLANESLNTCPYMTELLQQEERALAQLRDLESDLFNFKMRYSEVTRRGGDYSVEERERLQKAISDIHDDLQDYRRNIWSKCLDSGKVKPPVEYDIFSSALDILKKEKNWATLEFIWNPKRSQIMVYLLTPANLQLFETELTAQDLSEILNKYKTALIDQNIKLLANAADAFSQKIIPPEIHSELNKFKDLQYLFIIPHKDLHSIPFEIIHTNQDYWGLKYSLVKNFSLDLSRICIQKRKTFFEKHPKPKNAAMVVGNPTQDLTNAELEAQQVEEMLKSRGFNVKLLLRKKSKEDTFVKNLADKTIIHFAGHGVFITPEPILSHLLFTSSDLTAREIAQLKLKKIPIVVLSACETGIPGYLGGNELVGFVRSFILAGSTTLVSTNWPVSDVSARELVEKFYENLLKGASVGISLQKARQFIAQKYHNQILHWAAYTLFGDPFRKL